MKIYNFSNITKLCTVVYAIIISQNILAQGSWNLALDADVESSNETTAGPTEDAVDGDYSTYLSFGRRNVYTFEVDIENISDIDSIVITARSSKLLSMTIKGYDGDEDEWYEFDTTPDISNDRIVFIDEDLTEAEAWNKFEICGTCNNYLKFWEVEIYGLQIVCECGTRLQDSRDGQMYPTKESGELCCFLKNLNYNYVGHSYYYDDDSATYANEYGRLYDYPNVIADDVCPDGWRLPTWDELDDDVNWSAMQSDGWFVQYNNPYPGWYIGYSTGSSGYEYIEIDEVSHYLTSEIDAGRMITGGTRPSYSSVSTGYFTLNTRVTVRCVKSISSSKSLLIEEEKLPFKIEGYGVYLSDGIKLEDTAEQTTTIEEETTEYISGFSVYPNPSGGEFEMDINEIEDISLIEILSADGKIIQTMTKMPSENPVFNIEDKGIYLVRVIAGQKGYTRKIIIQ